MKTTLGFYGGVGEVTGANFMLDTGKVAIVVDCGLVQGDRFVTKKNADDFVYDPSTVDVLIVTHAHADHIGRVPKLVKDGFKGKIYSTAPTKDLSGVMLVDALKVMEFEANKFSTPILYDEEDIKMALSLWQTKDYDESFSLGDDIICTFTDAGHILGSAMVHLTRGDKKVVFTGDIGNVPQPLLRAPIIPKDYDYMVMESVYGDRSHEQVAERVDLLKAFIVDTIHKNGTLIIPAFSIERTQIMLYEINNLIESGEIDHIAVFLDSPLAISVTEIYRKYTKYLRPEVQAKIKGGDDIFDFPGLKLTHSSLESDAISQHKGAKIIIAGSGMSHGGRIRKHEQNYLGDPKTTVLLVGYQSVGSMGRLLQDGSRQVTIDGEKIKVKAKIEQIRGFSGHADRDQLVELVSHGGEKAKQVFVAMGEERSSLFLTQRLRDYLGINAVAPAVNEEVEIDF